MPKVGQLTANPQTVGTALHRLTEEERRFLAFVGERHQVYLRRRAGMPKPWARHTEYAPILQRYFCCNMYREFDKTTIWIRENWREPHADDRDLWFAMAVARVVNWPDSLAEIGYPVPWEPDWFIERLEVRENQGEKSFHNAYKPPTPRVKGMSRIPFVAHDVLDPLWRDQAQLRGIVHMSLRNAHDTLCEHEYIGTFLAAQILADLKYVPPLKNAPDWQTFAASGPGSRRGLNRIIGRRVEASWSEGEWYQQLRRFFDRLRPHFMAVRLPVPHLQDLQNQLCEWDKAERVRLTPESASLRRYPGMPTAPRGKKNPEVLG
jgi:hypothetical protein